VLDIGARQVALFGCPQTEDFGQAAQGCIAEG
jgi:hypothetical protein